MADEPIFKKLVRRTFGGGKESSEHELTELASHVPVELQRILSGAQADTPIIVHKVQSFLQNWHEEIDTERVRRYAERIHANTDAIRAIMEYRRTLGAAKSLDSTLELEGRERERQAKLAEEKHELEIRRTRSEAAAVPPPDLQQQVSEAKARADLAEQAVRLRELERKSSPAPPAQAPPPRDPVADALREAERIVAGHEKTEQTAQAVWHAFESHIVLARARGADDLVQRLEMERERITGDLRTGER